MLNMDVPMETDGYTLQLMLVGRILTDGRLNARVKCDLTDNLTMKINAQVFQDFLMYL